jgi:hypothetical protein
VLGTNRILDDNETIHEIWGERILAGSDEIGDETLVDNIPYPYPYNLGMTYWTSGGDESDEI